MNVFDFQREVRKADLPKEVKLLLFVLSTYWSPDRPVYASVATLAEQCGVQRRSLSDTLRKAERLGWIERVQRPGTSSIIHLKGLDRVCSPPPTQVCSPPPTLPKGVSGPPPTQVGSPPPRGYAVDRLGGERSTAYNHTNEQTNELSDAREEPERVRWLRAEVAKRWDAIVPATTQQVAEWEQALPGAELTMAVDAVQRKIDFAHSKGNPISTARRGWHVCDTLETHSKFRPNRTTTQDLTGLASQERQPKSAAATRAWQEFCQAKGIQNELE